MSDHNWQQIEEILDQALDLPKDKRREFIDTKCDGKPYIKSELTQLLESISDSEGWLEDPEEYKRNMYQEMADDVQLLSSGRSLIDTEVGSYLIKDKIGEGGMGSVYLAEHISDDFDHKVAIKIIRSGKATKENIQRFRREQQILAGLHHPGIARMFDAGATGDGFPYIIMEYVDGTPITDYCLKNSCTIEQKMELFKKVLQAVRYAHENLVIHRDLKPGNILVDESGHVKILDFGISKLLEDEDNQALTQTGARLLTPRYAAPEQVRQENSTTATDLYALGIVFYQLLTETHPFEFEDLSQFAIEQAILEQDAARPGSKVTDPAMKKQLQGDLEAIALKAIRKETDQRYRVANEFLDDLNNYQSGLPVSAAEDSFRYRSRKFFRRHQQGVAVAAGILLLIIGLTGYYTWRITQERDRARSEAAKAKEVTEMMVGLFEENNPSNLQGDTVSVRKVLERGTSRIRNELDEQPEVKAALLSAISRVHENLGLYEDATSLQEQALMLRKNTEGIAQADIAESLFILGNLHSRQGAYEVAETNYREALAIKRTIHEPTHPSIAKSLQNLGLLMKNTGKYEAADSLFRLSLKINRQHYDGDHPNIAKNINNLATLLARKGQLESAEPLFKEVLDLRRSIYGNEHPLTANSLNNLSVLYALQGDFEAAAPLIKEAVDIRRTILGEEHPQVAQSMGNLASVLRDMGDYEAAKPIYQEALVLSKKNFGAEHPIAMRVQSGLATLLTEQGNYEMADSLFQVVVSVQRQRLGDQHPLLAESIYKRALVQYRAGDRRSAIRLLEEGLQIQQATLPDGHRRTALTESLLGACLTAEQDYKEAQSLLQNSYASLNASRGRYDKDTQQVLQRLVQLFDALGQSREAAAYRDSLVSTPGGDN